MKIDVIYENGTVTLAVEGWLDTVSSPELGTAVESIGQAERIVLDFDQVEYMASAGLRQVIAAHKKAKAINAEFSVIHVGENVMSIFKMTGIDKKIDIQVR